jgi:hypothetical protein
MAGEPSTAWRPDTASPESAEEQPGSRIACQLCGSRLIEIRGKLQCQGCHTIWETCCEGARW